MQGGQEEARHDINVLQVNVPGHINSALLSLESILRRQLQLTERESEQSAAHTPNPSGVGINPSVTQSNSQNDESSDDDYDGTEGAPPREENERGDGEGGDGDDSTIDVLSGEMATRIELQPALQWLEQSFPFLALLFVVFLYEHRTGLLTFLWLTASLYHANGIVRKQVSLKQGRQPGPLGGVIVNLLLQVVCTYFLFQDNNFWGGLIFSPPSGLSFWDTVWTIVLSDLMVRYASMIIKAVAIILVGHLPPFKRRTQFYAVIEVIANLYRTLLPVSLWFSYFIGDKEERVFSSLMGGLYLIFKFSGVISKARQMVAIVRAYVLHELRYGKHASADQVMEVGDMCAICREKLRDPIVLPCGHIFCDDCVSLWFEREKTCPLCRTVITAVGYKTHSDGSTSLWVQLF